MRIAELSVRRPVFATVISLVLMIFGFVAMQRLAIRARHWGPVVTSQLASNAFGRIVPGGVAAAGYSREIYPLRWLRRYVL